MEKVIESGKWLKIFAIGLIVFLLIISAITYIIDPYFQYRVRDNEYFINGRFVSGGLLKNYEYDTLILGSSMTQNFNMNSFRQRLGAKPLHIGLGGMKSSEMIELVNLAESVGKSNKYYLCMDLYNTTSEEKSELYTYLLKNDPISKLRYSLSYEAWMRFIPIDLGIGIAKKLGISLPQKLTRTMSIDELENWNDDYEFGKDIVLNNFKNSSFAVSKVDNTDLLNKMKSHIDIFLEKLQLKNKEVNFFFPPYSALYWLNAQNEGYLESYLGAKRYFVEKATENGYNVYDFQGADLTLNLENYKDTTHYNQDINDWMVNCFAKMEYKVNTNSVGQYEGKLRSNVMKIRVELMDYFYKK